MKQLASGATIVLGVAAALLGTQPAEASLIVGAVIGGAPTGATLDNLDSLNLGDGTQTDSQGLIFNFTPDAQVVQGSQGGLYAAPYLSGNNGIGFGAGGGNQANGTDTSTYITSGSDGNAQSANVTITLPGEEHYFGLLWGSVDSYNTLELFDHGVLVGTITGSDVLGSPDGDEGPNGTVYVNIDSSLAFDSVEMTSSQYAFEFDDLSYDENQEQIPEPGSIALLGAGLGALGLFLFGARRTRA